MIATPAGIRQLVTSKQDTSTGGIGAWGWELWTAAMDHIKRHDKGQEGIIITFLRAKGPMDKAGVQLHDVVTHVDGKPIQRRNELVRTIRSHKPGDELKMRLLNGKNEVREVTVTLEDVTARWRARGKKK